MSNVNRRSVVFAFDHQATKMDVYESINGFPRDQFHEVEVMQGARKVKAFIPKDPNFTRANVDAGDLRQGV